MIWNKTPDKQIIVRIICCFNANKHVRPDFWFWILIFHFPFSLATAMTLQWECGNLIQFGFFEHVPYTISTIVPFDRRRSLRRSRAPFKYHHICAWLVCVYHTFCLLLDFATENGIFWYASRKFMVISKHCCYSCLLLSFLLLLRWRRHEYASMRLMWSRDHSFDKKTRSPANFMDKTRRQKTSLIMIFSHILSNFERSKECVPVEQLLKRSTVAF